jgi:hypothetical protein
LCNWPTCSRAFINNDAMIFGKKCDCFFLQILLSMIMIDMYRMRKKRTRLIRDYIINVWEYLHWRQKKVVKLVSFYWISLVLFSLMCETIELIAC